MRITTGKCKGFIDNFIWSHVSSDVADLQIISFNTMCLEKAIFLTNACIFHSEWFAKDQKLLLKYLYIVSVTSNALKECIHGFKPDKTWGQDVSPEQTSTPLTCLLIYCSPDVCQVVTYNQVEGTWILSIYPVLTHDMCVFGINHCRELWSAHETSHVPGILLVYTTWLVECAFISLFTVNFARSCW